MLLYVIRHAHAVDAEEDPQRPLSQRGRKQVRSLAKFLRKTGSLETAEVWHSPLARSRETAALLVEHFGLKARRVQIDGIEGEEDPSILVGRLKGRREPLAIVGHEPHLSAFLSLLFVGATKPPRFILKKCAAVALEKNEGIWAVRWQVSPEILDG